MAKLSTMKPRGERLRRAASEAVPKDLSAAMEQFAKVLPQVDEDAHAERAAAQRDRLARQQQAEIAKRWSRVVAQVGERYAKATIGGYRVENGAQRFVVDQLVAYCESIEEHAKAGRGIVLYGPPGTGKDHLAIAVLRRAVGVGLECEAIDGQVLFQRCRDAIGSDLPESALLRPYIKAGVLLLSDPVPPLDTSGGPKDYQLTVLWRIIDARYRAMRPTIVTINVAEAKEMERRLSPNLVDRLRDDSLGLPCFWESYRKSRNAP